MIGSNWVGFVGALLVLLASYDAACTTLSATNSGPLTNRILSTLWAMLVRLPNFRWKHAVLSATGAWFSLGLIIFWLVITWAGWFLLFCSSHDAVVNATTSTPASLIERVYFIGYTITTLGYGDFVPGDSDWKVPATVAAANGFFLFTLAVTYMLNVVSSVTQKRQLALSISALGKTPAQILQSSADKGSFVSLSIQAQQLQQSINTVGQQHLAFPILHYYHGEHSDKSLSLALARLYQALALVCYGNNQLSPTTRSQLVSAKNVVEQFLDTLGSAFIKPKEESPDIPDLTSVAELPGFNRSSSDLQSHLQSIEKQKLFLAYVNKDGWEWQEVW